MEHFANLGNTFLWYYGTTW